MTFSNLSLFAARTALIPTQNSANTNNDCAKQPSAQHVAPALSIINVETIFQQAPRSRITDAIADHADQSHSNAGNKAARGELS